MRYWIISFIHILICGLSGLIMGKAKMDTKNWQYWVLLICIIGSYYLGRLNPY